MFVTEMEGEEYTYGHCYEDADDGTESGCGMEYEYRPKEGTLARWHDAVGLVTHTEITEEKWHELVEWHEQNCREEERA